MSSRPSRARWESFAAAAVLLLALALRLYHLDAQSLWNDEGTSVALALRDLATIARHASYDIHPPLYYVLLHFWVAGAGAGEFAVRALSTLEGVALVAGVWTLARRTAGRTVAPLAALLAAVAPFGVYYSQEARMYVGVALFGLLATLAFERLLFGVPAAERATTPRISWRVAYVVAGIAAIYSHYLGATVLVAHNLVFLARWFALPTRRWRALGGWVTLQAAVALAYVPWLAVSWRSLSHWPAVSAGFSLSEMLGDAARALVWGPATGPGWRATGVALAVTALAAAGAVLAGGTISRCAREAGVARGGEGGKPPRGFGALLLALYLIVPIALMAGASLGRPMFKLKFALLVLPPFVVLVAEGIVALGRRAASLLRRQAAGVAFAALLSVGALAPAAQGLGRLYWDPTTYRDDYRGIAAYIAASAGPDDAILINAPAQIETFDYYYRGPLAEYPLPRQRPMDASATVAELEALAARHSRIYAVLWATGESDPERVIEGWLDTHAFKALDGWFGNVRLAMYAFPRSAEGADVRPAGHVLEAAGGGRLRLDGYSVLTPAPAGGDVLQVALHWQALAPISARYKVFVHLVDAAGNIVAQRDSEPGGGARLTSDWAVGETVVDQYGLLIPAGTPPGEHVLRVGMYGLDDGRRLSVALNGQEAGDRIDLARVAVAWPPSPPPEGALDRQARHDVAWGGLRLIGHSLHRLGSEHETTLALRPGDAARLVLYWRREPGAVWGRDVAVSLTDRRGRIAWESVVPIAPGSGPPATWREGESARDVHALPLPADLPPGTYRLGVRPMAESTPYTLQTVTLNE